MQQRTKRQSLREPRLAEGEQCASRETRKTRRRGQGVGEIDGPGLFDRLRALPRFGHGVDQEFFEEHPLGGIDAGLRQQICRRLGIKSRRLFGKEAVFEDRRGCAISRPQREIAHRAYIERLRECSGVADRAQDCNRLIRQFIDRHTGRHRRDIARDGIQA